MSLRSRSANPATTSEIAGGKIITVRSSVRGKMLEERLQIRARLLRAEIHLPVGGEDGLLHADLCRRAPRRRGALCLREIRATHRRPWRRDSSCWRDRAARTAAAESPPPTIVVAPFAVAAASALATAFVPRSNGGFSNTPIGPFHNTVFARSISSANRFADAGPMSNMACSAGIASRDTAFAAAPASSDGRDERIHGQHELVSRAREQRLRHLDAIRLDERLPRLEPHRLEERARHRAADEQLVDLRQAAPRSRRSCPEIFAPPRIATNGLHGLVERVAEILELALHQQVRRPRA